ncbi:hypothetical protein [Leuconostoc citreum]
MKVDIIVVFNGTVLYNDRYVNQLKAICQDLAQDQKRYWHVGNISLMIKI